MSDDQPIVPLLRSLIVSTQLSNGYMSWTLATRLGEMMKMIEEVFGPRVQGYMFLGIEFNENGPNTWYPHSGKHVLIRLSLRSILDVNQALWELAQESVHLLSPGPGAANILEEGLATKFARDYMRNIHNWSAVTGSANYDEADTLATELLQRWPDCIKQMRLEEPVISRFTPELMEKYCAGIDSGIITRLLAKHNGR